jgi:ATP-dependent DNA helicase RecQ
MTAHEVLKQYWGFDKFRPLQEEIIQSVISGKDTLALLPTGGGKSICYQVPALMHEGVCLVISPLIALMKDQVEGLQKKGIPAKAIYSGMSSREIDITLDNMAYGDYKFLYLSPERLHSDMLKARLKKMKINLLAVDESHCISQWGYDFRPDYLRIAEVREFFPQVPVLAVTATATVNVIADIQEKLQFKEKNVFSKSFERSNLVYAVLNIEDKWSKLLDIVKVKGSGVVYVRNRKTTREIADFLSRNRHSADAYHAGLTAKERSQRQQNWIDNSTRIIVCTNAFGMGIDKPDVRFVVHWEMPDSLEAYYQEAGRAGRDEKKAYCVLLYQPADRLEAEQRIQKFMPAPEEIRRVYHALGNYFQLAVGSGAFIPLDFDIAVFCKQFNFNPTIAVNALKVLQQHEYLSLSEAVFTPSKLIFLFGNTQLYEFQVAHAYYDELVKLILRSHGGAFDNYVSISEADLAKKRGVSKEVIVADLKKLQQLAVVEYQPQKELPQLVLEQPRLDAKHLLLDTKMMNHRREVYKTKVNAVINYASQDLKCRSRVLLEYFNEENSRNCGHCDVCIEINRQELGEDELMYISSKIKKELNGGRLELPELVKKFGQEDEKRVLKTIRWMADNGEIFYDNNELVSRP